MTPQRVIDRVRTKVEPGPNDCVLSTYSTNSKGYARVHWGDDGVSLIAYCHRIAWEAVHGPIPDDLTVDHTCHTRNCVNVDHLRLLSRRVNATLNGQAFKTHCPQGHSYDETNTRLLRSPNGRFRRDCRRCHNKRKADRRKARKLAAA